MLVAGRNLPAADQHADVFRSVREAHLMESTEDYVELIDDLIASRGEARLVDIAEYLGISQPTASKTVGRLRRDGFVSSEPYRAIFLTSKGKALAAHTRQRHDIVYRFLLALGVSDAVAKRDSEGVEHHVSAETLAAFERVIDDHALMAGLLLIVGACVLWALDTLIRYPLLFSGVSAWSIVWLEHAVLVIVLSYWLVPLCRHFRRRIAGGDLLAFVVIGGLGLGARYGRVHSRRSR